MLLVQYCLSLGLGKFKHGSLVSSLEISISDKDKGNSS